MEEHYLIRLIKEKRLKPATFAKEIGLSRADRVYNVLKFKNNMTEDLATMITDKFNDVSFEWLLTGEGEMIKMEGRPLNYFEEKQRTEKLIPLYNDVITYGGNVESLMNPVSNPTEYINAGSWFGDAKITAAIRHYGDSMLEYPNGCILALKEIRDFENIVYGRNYVVETDEIRVTKRLQSGIDDLHFMAYSTNIETYPDGRQVHEPFRISKEKITRVMLVVGRIVKEHGSSSVITI